MTAPLDVLHADNHVLAVNKPVGVPTVPDASGDESLLDRAKAWVKATYGKPGRVFLGVVHRLDRPVSGVVLFGRTSKGAARLSDELRRRAIKKTYWGVVDGKPRTSEGRLEQWLVKDTERNVVSVVSGPESDPGAKPAVTLWRVLAKEGTRTILELTPETGRTHQLRVACASLGQPLLGDLKYGAEQALPDRSVALHARAIAFTHPTQKTELRIEADPPGSSWWSFAPTV